MDEKLIADYIKTLPPSIFGLTHFKSIECTPLTGGVHHINFKAVVTDPTASAAFVLRFATKKQEAEALHNEHWYIHLLDPSVTPESIYYAAETPFGLPLLITRFATGNHIDFNELSDRQIRRLADIIYKVHGIQRDQFSVGDAMLPDLSGSILDYTRLAISEFIDKRYEEVAGRVPHDEVLYRRARKLLEEQLQRPNDSWMAKRFSLCHGDTGSTNVLWEGDTPCLIDWDGANFGDPANEIGYIFAISNTSKDWQQTFLDAYMQHEPSSTVSQRIDVHILKNRLADVVWSMGKIHEATKGDSKVGITLDQSTQWYKERIRNLRNYVDNLS